MKKNDTVIGRIFDVQRFSTHDGDGIRTTIFFKGCPPKMCLVSKSRRYFFRRELDIF